MMKSIWKFLTEDPSKGVPNPPEPVVKKEVVPDPEVKIPVITLHDKILTLKNNVNRGILSPTSSAMSDIQVLHVDKSYDDYDSGFGDMYGGFDDYDRGYDGYRRRILDSSQRRNSYEVIMLISGRLFFRDIHPSIGNDGSIPMMDNSGRGLMKIGEDDIESSFVKDITLSLTLKEDTRISPSESRVSISVKNLSVRRTLSDQSGIKTRSNDYHQITIDNRRTRCVGYEDLIHLIRKMFPDIRETIENNFKEEVTHTKKQIKINNTLREFDDKINENSVRDCFAYAMDELGVDSCSVSLMGVKDRKNSIVKDMSGKYWQVFIGLDTNRRNGVGDTQIKMDDKSLNILFEINEGINKIKQMYDKCKMTLNICDSGGFKIDIYPIIEGVDMGFTLDGKLAEMNSRAHRHELDMIQAQAQAQMQRARMERARYDDRYDDDLFHNQ